MRYIIFLFLGISSLFAQRSQTSFQKIDSLLRISESSTSFLNDIENNFKEDLKYQAKVFGRDVDFGYQHQRFSLNVNQRNIQVDLLLKNDSIIAKSIADDSIQKLKSTDYSVKIEDYLKLRNQFYYSQKKAQDLLTEMAKNQLYASSCGEGFELTNEMLKIKQLAEAHDSETLLKLLQGFLVEEQCYAVAGFLWMQKEGFELSDEILKIIEYIKNRNSEIVTCHGCTIGFIEKPYKIIP